MGYKIGIFTLCLFLTAQVLWGQCDDDDDLPPTGSFEVQGGGSCGSAIFRLKFTLSSSDDDDDDDNDDRFNLSYQIGAQTFQLSGVADGHEVEHTINSSTTATFLTLSFGSCTANINQSISLEVLAAPSQNISTTNPACNQNNGTIVSTGTGGTAPYEFSLNGSSFQSSGSFSNLAAGTYTVNVRDAQGCTASASTTLQAPSSPGAGVSSIRQPTCAGNDGQIQVQAQGGQAPYTYAFNGGAFQNNTVFSGLAPGTYRISVRDSRGCEGSVSVALNSANGNLAPATIAGNANIVACLLEDIRLQGNLPAGTTGRWTLSTNLGTLSNAQNAQTTFKPTQAGTMEAIWTLSAAGCANYSQAKILINVAAAPLGKDFPGIEVNKDAVSVPLYTGSNLYEIDVLRQGKKGSANIGVDHVLLYTPKAGESGPDTVYYTICAAECPNACDTNWVAFVLTNEDAICELEKIDPRVVFPEGITPNDDGYNDALIFNIVDKLGCPSNYAQSDITIFNRWADKVFVQEPYENQWNGTTRDGGALPPGVYYYVLRIRPEGRKEFVKFGSVSIFK